MASQNLFKSDLGREQFESTVGSDTKPQPEKAANGVVLIPQPSSDPKDPLNWSYRKKYTTLAVWSFACFSSQACAMANQQGYFKQAPLYGKTPIEVSYSISTALGGITAGAMIAVPLARKFGLCFCLLWSTVGLLASQIWSACMTGSNDYNAFVVSRLVAGIFAGAPLILGSQIILHVFFLHERGKAFHIIHVPFLLGVVLAPAIGGFIIFRSPWPIQFWWTVGLCGLTIILTLLFLDDTEYDRTESQTPGTLSEFDSILKRRIKTYFYASAPHSSVTLAECGNILLNEILVGLCPVSLLAGFFLMIDFGFATTAYILLIVFLEDPTSEGGYGFNSVQAACFTFALWIGLAAAEVYGHAVSDRLPLWFCRRAGGLWKPEYRLYCLWAPVTILAIGLGLFGAALQYHVHFMVLALGAFFIWSGAMSIVPVTMTYLCETFADHVPEVSAIMGLYRLALGLSTPFFATAWISKVTVGWLFGMAACFTIPAFGLICVLIWKGPQIRMLSPNRFKPSDKKFNISGSDVV